jgi:hypothetical protein
MAPWPSESVYDWTGNELRSVLLRDCLNHLLADCAESKEVVASGESNPEHGGLQSPKKLRFKKSKPNGVCFYLLFTFERSRVLR